MLDCHRFLFQKSEVEFCDFNVMMMMMTMINERHKLIRVVHITDGLIVQKKQKELFECWLEYIVLGNTIILINITTFQILGQDNYNIHSI